MSEPWDHHLPQEYRSRVIVPVHFEHHRDAAAQADKTLGFDLFGNRCFYRHQFLLTEERFDSEEFPIQVDLYKEIVLAWRLIDGSKWLKLKIIAENLDHCHKRIATLPLELTEEQLLQY